MNSGRRSPLVHLLVTVLWLECASLAGVTGFLVVELILARPDSYASAIALTVVALIAAVWLAVIALNLGRGRAWTRGAALVWQVLQIAIAVGSFQGPEPRPAVGWALLIPAAVVIWLLFTRPVIAATARRGDASAGSG